MSSSSPPELQMEGLPSVRNWQAKVAGAERVATFEYPLYSDARFTGEIRRTDWPYQFLNTIPVHDEPGLVQAPVILRADLYAPQSDLPDWSKTDTSTYHGGLMTDEVAALASLCLGVRLRSGGESRRFDGFTTDPLGQPVAWDRRPMPSIGLSRTGLVLPDVVGKHSLDPLSRLESLHRLTVPQTVALVRAARLYQDALWIVESEPALAWLMFVSALETGANEWSVEKGTPEERLAASRPELMSILFAAGGQTLVAQVAKEIESSLGATKKFIQFSLRFLPSAPERRPTEAFQISWLKEPMKAMLRAVYGYRSKALHGGTPFPAPMCDPAFRVAVTEWFSERGTMALAASTKGGIWLEKDLPISLHTFHYVVRGALLRWWTYLAGG